MTQFYPTADAEITSDIAAAANNLGFLHFHIVNVTGVIATGHDAWTEDDSRLTVFTRLNNVTFRTFAAMDLLSTYGTKKGFWDQLAGVPIPQTHFIGQMSGLSQFHRFNFLHAVFSQIESTLRSILRSLNPNSCNGSTGEFANVYTTLYKTELGAHAEFIDLLDFMRLIRNTVHNNGVYLHKSGTSRRIVYRDNEFEFVHSKALNFVGWGLLVPLAHDAVDMLHASVTHPLVASLSKVQDLAVTL